MTRLHAAKTLFPSAILLAIALAGPQALAASASAPPTFGLSQSSSSGAVCRADANYADPAAQVPHAKAWTVTCRGWGDVPFGRVYLFDASGPSPLDPMSAWQAALRGRASCPNSYAATMAIAGATASDCTTAAGKQPYRVYEFANRRTIAIAEGMTALSDVIELALKVVTGNAVPPSAAAPQTTVALSREAAADLARAAEAARRAPEYARAQGYLSNQGWGFGRSEEYFRELATDPATAPAARADARLNWALAVSNQGRFADAELRFAEAGQIVASLNDPLFNALELNYRALHLLNQRKFDEAERVANDAVGLRARIDPYLAAGPAAAAAPAASGGAFQLSPSLTAKLNEGGSWQSRAATRAQRLIGQNAQAFYVIGVVRSARGDAAGARENLERADALITEARSGVSMGWQRAQIYRELAQLDAQAGRTDQAIMRMSQALDAYQLQSNLRAKPAEAALYMARARIETQAGRTEQGLADYEAGFELFLQARGTVGDSAELTNSYFELLIAQARMNPQREREYQGRFFEALQSIVSPSTADTIARVAARLSQNGAPGADIARALDETDRQITIKQSEINRRQVSGEYPAALRAADEAELKTLTNQRNADNEQLVTQNALYGQLRATTASLDAMQAVLRPGELYVKNIVLGQGGYGLAISKETVRIFTLGLTRKEADAAVAAVRRPFEGGVTLPRFDVAASHNLYKALFGPVQDLMANTRHLIYDADGSLVSVPAAVFVTDDASETRFKQREAQFVGGRYDIDLYDGVAWLGRNAEISLAVAPSAFLQARAFEPSRAQYAFLGLGDPVLRSARAPGTGTQTLGPDPRQFRLVADPANGTNNPACEQVRTALATGLVNTDMAPMIRNIGSRLGAREQDVVLGSNFTDANLLSRQDLNNYKVVFFGTHGLLPTKEDCLPEPALVTSLGGGDSDAFLDASEIVQLRLDADLVVLAACDTGGRGSESADRTGLTGSGEALGGLARDFIYAGSRGLVVSQWSVDLNATVALLSALFNSRGENQAAAFRRAETTLMNNGRFSHPYYWAAFSLIGDGARPMPGS